MTLFLGFGGGVNAFIPAAMNYGVTVSREMGLEIVKTFRTNQAKLVEFWDNALQAAVWAVAYPGQEFHVPPKGLISFICREGVLLARLPSGRYLRYWAPRLEQGFWPDGNPKAKLDLTVLVVKGTAVFRRTLWRGLLCENLTQAIAADMLAVGLVNMEQSGIMVDLHVHDNIAAEEDEDQVAQMLPVFERAMLHQPAWTTGLPVAVAADASARFA